MHMRIASHRTGRLICLAVVATALLSAAPATSRAETGPSAEASPQQSATSQEATPDLSPGQQKKKEADEATNAIYQALLTRFPDQIGGVRVNGTGSKITVTVTSQDIADQVPAIIAETVSPVPKSDVRLTKHSEKRLRSVTDRAGERAMDLRSQGIKLWFWSTSSDEETITLKIEPDSRPDSEEVLAEEFGADLVTVSRAPLNSSGSSDRYTDYPSVRAGLGIISSANFGCTAGFTARSRNNGNYYVLSAGHCDNGSGDEWKIGRDGRRGANKIGNTGTNRMPNGSGVTGSCDCLAIGPLTPSRATNTVYTSPTAGQKITAVCGQNCLGQGVNVCYSGASSASNPVTCAPEGPGLYSKYGGCYRANIGSTINNAGMAYAPASVSGDSGGPVYYFQNAVGIMSGNCDGLPTWTWIDIAQNSMAVDVLTFQP